MAEKRRFLDVWIIETNTVYREVPFLVVTDWLQQGRLLADDKVRPSGTAEWYAIGAMPSLSAYLPKVQEHRAEDQAEALEKVEVDFSWKRRPEDDDEDVDMIPLIDVSLVLLVFFLMTTAISVGLFGDINLPSARRSAEELSQDMKLVVKISLREKKEGPDVEDRSKPWYSLVVGDKEQVKPTRNVQELVKPLQDELKGSERRVLIRIAADQKLPVEVLKNMMVQLKNFAGKVPIELRVEVRQPQIGSK
jgi:biopolymer transport protein ExbD